LIVEVTEPPTGDGPRARDWGDGPRARDWSWVAVDLILLLVAAFVIGAIISWVGFKTAQIPPFSATADLGVWRVLLTGLRWLGVMVVAFAVLGLLGYAFAGRKWHERRSEWHRLVVRGGVRKARLKSDARDGQADGEETAPLGENAVRILAGFNIGALSGVVTAIVVAAVERILTDSLWVLVPVGIVLFLGIYVLLTDWGPLKVGHRTHAGIWVLVALIAALFTTLPLGLLILVGVAISTAGRMVARTELPRMPSKFLRSPLPWMLMAAYILVGVAYHAVPPVPFQRDVLSTASGERVAGYLWERARARTSSPARPWPTPPHTTPGWRSYPHRRSCARGAAGPRITWIPVIAHRWRRSRCDGSA
jgi:ABC-type multidrug transport system fused ATPase/permease subunit